MPCLEHVVVEHAQQLAVGRCSSPAAAFPDCSSCRRTPAALSLKAKECMPAAVLSLVIAPPAAAPRTDGRSSGDSRVAVK
jgi:hypothetical protein